MQSQLSFGVFICFYRAIAAFESYLVSIYGSSSRELHSLQAWKAIGNYRRIPENKESQRIAKSIKIHKFVFNIFSCTYIHFFLFLQDIHLPACKKVRDIIYIPLCCRCHNTVFINFQSSKRSGAPEG